MDTVLGNPGMTVSKGEFKELFRKLFDMDFESVFDFEESNRSELTSRTTQSIREETTNLNRLKYMDDVAKKLEYSRRIRLLKEILRERSSYSSGQYLDMGTELEINRKLVKYLDALNGIYEKSQPSKTHNEDFIRLSGDVGRQEELLSVLGKKFNENNKKITGSVRRTVSFLKIIILVTISLMVASYVLSLLADMDEENYASYYYDNEDGLMNGLL
ncbi:DEKNAAC104487 [Brettanomyces naardenensis]|uniref:DEKNAAC104487 n=1 Tax=Brettanomyces naardenensis TaxID=13370 RepID=A0A448YRM5_BRENA|nr:DEKNAAC104487 [Brettanomyces naardenensis]